MGKLEKVGIVSTLKLSDYRPFDRAGERKLRAVARPLRGKKILHVNATARGGGVAELLQSQVLFERALGIKSYWYVVKARRRFFAITKQMHDLLQGKRGRLGPADRAFYGEVSREFERSFARVAGVVRPDVIVIHDPQPMGLAAAAASHAPVVVRLHGDLLTPNPETMEFVRPFIMRASRVVVSNKSYLVHMPWLEKKKAAVIYPAIDPLSEKNRDLSPEIARKILSEFGVNQTKPMIAQVSRFDPWKDPLGVIKAYYIAKNKIPDLQLVLSGLFIANDDPEAVEIFRQVRKHAAGDPDIFLFSDPRSVRGQISIGLFVSATYTASTVVIQKSIREGFGLTMTEAMWKGKPVVAGATSGAFVQIKSGKNGIIVSSAEEAAKAIIKLVKDERMRDRLGRAARETVRRRFLMPRFVLDNIKLYRSILAS